MLVFQYGSNCMDSQINGESRLRGDARAVGIAVAENHELSFDIHSHTRNCAASNIVPEEGAVAWGVLYEIPDELIDRENAKPLERKSLDAIEGEGSNYRRCKINVRRPDGELVEATTYTVIAPRPGLKTGLEYAGFIVAGLRERGVPETYIARVKEIAAANNPEIALDLEKL
jgi:hypothetical protein